MPFAVEVDGMRIGIRAQDEHHQLWLRELLSDHLVSDTGVGPNYSVRVSDDAKALHLLYWGGCLVARCRTEEELVVALDAHLGGHRVPAEGTVRLSGLVLRRGEDAVLLTNVDQAFGAKLVGRLRDIDVVPEVRPWVDAHARTHRLAPRPTVGLRLPSTGPVIRSLLLPAAVHACDAADRVLALKRAGSLSLEGGSLEDAVVLLSTINTQSVDDYRLPYVAASLRDVLLTLDAFKR